MVDLPLPEGPSRHTNSPAATRRDAPRKISTCPSGAPTLNETSSSAMVEPACAAGTITAGASEAISRLPSHSFADANTPSL
jgi:hypothetical protein